MWTYIKRRHSILTLNIKINCDEMNLLFHKSLKSSFDVSNEKIAEVHDTAWVCWKILTCGVQHWA